MCSSVSAVVGMPRPQGPCLALLRRTPVALSPRLLLTRLPLGATEADLEPLLRAYHGKVVDGQKWQRALN